MPLSLPVPEIQRPELAQAGLFADISPTRELHLPPEAFEMAGDLNVAPSPWLDPGVDDRLLDVYARAQNPADPIELRDLWIGRVEHELGPVSHRPDYAQRWRETRTLRQVAPDDVLRFRSTVRFVKELFNFYFRDDLYGDLGSSSNVLLSGGSVDEEAWGLPEALKSCVRYALGRDWYGYSDSRGRVAARSAIAAYESGRIAGAGYETEHVAITLGGTSAVSMLADFILSRPPAPSAPTLCAIPNYPPLVESFARRGDVELVPLPCMDGYTSVEPLIARLSPMTPAILLQSAANPTGAIIAEADLARLVQAAAPSTMIVVDECHEWLGERRLFAPERARSNVIRVSSASKAWSIPGMKVGWILADKAFIADYYEYASTTMGGPPSFFYTLVEVLARMERWLEEGVSSLTIAHLREFEATYGLDLDRLQTAFDGYCNERRERASCLTTMRAAAVSGLQRVGASVTIPRYSINIAVDFGRHDDSYLCFRDLLRESRVSVFPGILTFCLSGGVCRITSARQWTDLAEALSRLAANRPL